MFNPSGSIIYTSSADRSFAVISNGRVEGRLENAHDEAINSLIHIENDHVISTGDDDGVIKIWDLREAHKTKKASIEFTQKEDGHEGSITD